MRVAIVTLALAGCFGAGGVPAAPTKVTTIYAVPAVPASQQCNGSARYIGDVAFGSAHGYLITLPYVPTTGCGSNTGGNQGVAAVELTAFDLTGADLATRSLGSAGSVGPGTELPRVAVGGDTPAWMFQEAQMNKLTVDLGTVDTQIAITTMMGDGPAGLAIAPDGSTYVASIARTNGTTNFEDPQYPCCGFGLSSVNPPLLSTISRIAPQGTAAVAYGLPLSLFCDSLDSCLAVNTSAVFTMEHVASQGGARVRMFPTTATSAGDVVELGQLTSDELHHMIPVGMAADDHGVAFAGAQDPTTFGYGPGCVIKRYDLDTHVLSTLLTTASFWCQDLAVDEHAAYFTITDVSSNQGDQRMRGIGIGRVSFDGATVDTVRLGMEGLTAGPRRVFVAGGFVYAVDPTVIGRIAVDDLTGQDIVP